MRQVKHRNAKRAVEFFVLNASFRQPFKVILDGNFIHTALTFKMQDLEKRLGDLLQVPAKQRLRLSLTTCILAELSSLGPEFKETLDWARESFDVTECQHKGEPLQPDDCIQSLIGTDNEDQYFVATQDSDLRAALGGLLGGATLFISVNGVHISQPTAAQKALAEQSIKQSMQPSQTELQSEALGNLSQSRKPLKTSSKFKKVSRGGANPLSVKQSGGSKKKRPGPRLRNALKAAALAKEAGKSTSEAAHGGSGEKKSDKKKRRKKKQILG